MATSPTSSAPDLASRGRDLPNRARVVIVGGGVIGCSVAYHLGKLGLSDVVLLCVSPFTSVALASTE